jgi:hypothetical protein
MPSRADVSAAASQSSASEEFDPLAEWLNIPPQRRPPTHYDLFGLDLLEDDPELIRQAAMERLSHVRKYQLSPHSEQALQILDQMSKAYVCLTDPELKARYDDQFLPARLERAAQWSHPPEGSWAVVESTYPRDGVPSVEPPETATQRPPISRAAAMPDASPPERLTGLARLLRSLAALSGVVGVIMALVLMGRHDNALMWLGALVLAALAASALLALAAVLETTAQMVRQMERRLEQIQAQVQASSRPRRE